VQRSDCSEQPCRHGTRPVAATRDICRPDAVPVAAPRSRGPRAALLVAQCLDIAVILHPLFLRAAATGLRACHLSPQKNSLSAALQLWEFCLRGDGTIFEVASNGFCFGSGANARGESAPTEAISRNKDAPASILFVLQSQTLATRGRVVSAVELCLFLRWIGGPRPARRLHRHPKLPDQTSRPPVRHARLIIIIILSLRAWYGSGFSTAQLSLFFRPGHLKLREQTLCAT
jgi:hypothetical protein